MVKKRSQDRFNYSDESRLVMLLRNVPTEAFVSMVSKANLPPREARELCQQFKALKG